MAGFGDNETNGTFQRGGVAVGGLRVEGGCWTAGSSASICVPTQLTTVYSFVGDYDGTQTLEEPAEISGDNIVATTNQTTTDLFISYIACGV